MVVLKCRHLAVLGCFLATASIASSGVINPSTTASLSLESNSTLRSSEAEVTVTPTATRAYWIRRRPDYKLLYISIPISAGILLAVLIFFLWVFSSKPESPQDNYDYDRLEEEVVPGPSNSAVSPTHPVVDQIFDLPYTNPVEVNDDLPTV